MVGGTKETLQTEVLVEEKITVDLLRQEEVVLEEVEVIKILPEEQTLEQETIK